MGGPPPAAAAAAAPAAAAAAGAHPPAASQQQQQPAAAAAGPLARPPAQHAAASASDGSAPQHQQQRRGASGAQHHSVWLAPERFEAPDFSPDQCVAELRRYVPLPTVKAELQAHLVHLKNKLVEALNEDYADYVGLSSQLAGLEGGVVRMRQPLLDIQAKLAGVQDGLKAELSALQQGLQRRQDAAAARATLELMLEVAASTSKVEKLLSELAAAGQQQQQQQQQQPAAPDSSDAAANGGGGGSGGDSADLDARCRMLLRVAGEAARLIFLAERGKHLSFVKALERRIDGARFGLNRQLQAALGGALSTRAWGPAGHCLRGFLELGEVGQAEEGLRHHLAGPLVRQVVTDVRQQQLAANAAGGGGSNGNAAAPASSSSSSPLTQVASLTLSRLRETAGPLLGQLTAPGGGLGGIDLLGAVLLAELSTAVADGLPGLFSPGNPAAFHANYLAGQELLGALEGCAASRGAVERFRASEAAGAWGKRWNLPVYFSLMYQDIASTFEAAATAGSLQRAADAKLTAPLPAGGYDGAGGGGAGGQQQLELRLAVSACLWGCLQRTLSPSVFLLQLGDKFCRLLTQLLVRYDSWLSEVVQQRQEATAAAAAAAAAASVATASAATAAGPPAAASAAGGGAPLHQPGTAAAEAGGAAAAAPAAAAAGPAAWAPSMTSESAALICADADVIKALVQGPLVDQLRRLLASLPPDLAQQLAAMLAALGDSIGHHGQRVLLLLAGDVLEQCVAAVRQLKGITATYRMTAKGPPVRHSHYVAGVLQPLRLLLERPPLCDLPERLRLLLARDVIDTLNDRYRALAEELLTTVKKTESSLKRLKKTRPGEPAAAASGDGSGAAPSASAAGAAAAAMSDSDKICLQLYLDVQEHGRQISRFGLAADALESYTALLAAVTPPDRQPQQPQQQQQPEQVHAVAAAQPTAPAGQPAQEGALL